MSWISLAAIAAYACTALLCARASLATNGIPRLKRDGRIWAFCCVFFVAQILIRSADLESILRDSMRLYFRQENLYDERWQMQAVVSSVLLIIGVAGTALAFKGWLSRLASRRRLLVYSGALAILGFIPLFAMRFVSLHAIDSMLYGPLKLNWVLDVVLTGVAAGTAAFYTAHIRDRITR